MHCLAPLYLVNKAIPNTKYRPIKVSYQFNVLEMFNVCKMHKCEKFDTLLITQSTSESGNLQQKPLKILAKIWLPTWQLSNFARAVIKMVFSCNYRIYLAVILCRYFLFGAESPVRLSENCRGGPFSALEWCFENMR